jgi:glucose/arabinose dehydrogenase
MNDRIDMRQLQSKRSATVIYSAITLTTVALALAASVLAAALPMVDLQLVSEGFTSPLAMAQMPDGRSLAIDQIGVLRLLGTDGKAAPGLVADFRNKMPPLNINYDERGLLDIALHPQFGKNRRVFLFYNTPLSTNAPAEWNCSVTISEFTLPDRSPLALDMASEKVLLHVDKPYANHNGGRVAFGPDGYLYIGIGDGGAGNDQGLRPPEGNGQNLQTLMGKVLRIDVDHGSPYTTPADSPFADGKFGKPEIYAYGFRNPWGLAFDRAGNHELFVADVGQNLYEEVDIVAKGANFGWNRREGFHGFDPQKAETPNIDGLKTGAKGEPLVDPILEYPHRSPNPAAPQGVSVIGGYVYRGKMIPDLEGRYIFADWTRTRVNPGDGRIMAASRPGEGARWDLEYLPIQGKPGGKLGFYIVSFAQDNAGELYILTNDRGNPIENGGKIWKIVPSK